MSLLEDVFLEDEAGEAQELERIIEGDEYDEVPRALSPGSDDNSEKEDEAEEDKRRIDPTSAKIKRVVKNPRVVLNPARLMGPRGIQVIPDHFKDFKFKGKGHEKEDLDLVLKKLEHWAYRLYPKFQFDDCLKKIETLGKKRPVMVHLTKIRSDQYISEETVVQRDSSDEEAPQAVPEEDEFDKLLQQQIDLARATPVASSARKQGFSTPIVDRLSMPKATSSPSINDEQRDRMLRNRQMAEERRLARLKQNSSETSIQHVDNTSQYKTNDSKGPVENDTPFCINTVQNKDKTNEHDEMVSHLKTNRSNVIDSSDEEEPAKINESINYNESNSDVRYQSKQTVQRLKSNRSNVIDSSDEDEVLVVNESITADVHNSHRCHSDYEDNSVNNSVKRNTVDEDTEEITNEHLDIEMKEVHDDAENLAKASPYKDIEQINTTENSTIEEGLSEIAKVGSHEDIILVNNTEKFYKPATESTINIESGLVNTNSVTESLPKTPKSDNSGISNKDSETVRIEDCCDSFKKQNEKEKTVINEKKNDTDKENELDDIMDMDFTDDF